MLSTKNITFVLFISCVFITIMAWTLQGVARPSNPMSEPSKKINPPDRILRQGGWKLPDGWNSPNGQKKIVEIVGRRVSVQAHFPKSAIVEFEEYFVVSQSELKIVTQKCRLATAFVYSVNDKPFAVQASYNPVMVEQSNIIPTAAVLTVLFVDNDGDGLFEERNRLVQPSAIPHWVDAK